MPVKQKPDQVWPDPVFVLRACAHITLHHGVVWSFAVADGLNGKEKPINSRNFFRIYRFFFVRLYRCTKKNPPKNSRYIINKENKNGHLRQGVLRK